MEQRKNVWYPRKPTKESEEGAVLCPRCVDSTNKLGAQIQTAIIRDISKN